MADKIFKPFIKAMVSFDIWHRCFTLFKQSIGIRTHTSMKWVLHFLSDIVPSLCDWDVVKP